MTSIAWVVLAFILGGVQTLLACALGGWLVYRTKREPHEAMFQAKAPQGEVASLDDLLGGDEEDPVPSMFAQFEAQNGSFLDQLRQRGGQADG